MVVSVLSVGFVPLLLFLELRSLQRKVPQRVLDSSGSLGGHLANTQFRGRLSGDKSRGVCFIAFVGLFQEIPVVVDELDVKDFSAIVPVSSMSVSVFKSFFPVDFSKYFG